MKEVGLGRHSREAVLVVGVSVWWLLVVAWVGIVGISGGWCTSLAEACYRFPHLVVVVVDPICALKVGVWARPAFQKTSMTASGMSSKNLGNRQHGWLALRGNVAEVFWGVIQCLKQKRSVV